MFTIVIGSVKTSHSTIQTVLERWARVPWSGRL